MGRLCGCRKTDAGDGGGVDCIYVHQDGSIHIRWKFGDGVMEE